jgi:molecular chaperone GrpE
VSDPSAQDLAAKLDDLVKEVRRQGRAAIAAQAAAESCLEAVKALEAGGGEREDGEAGRGQGLAPERSTLDAAAEEALRWLREVIPVADALERIAAQATALEAPRPQMKRGLLLRLLRIPQPEPIDDAGARAALREGLRVLRAQLEATLAGRGVTVDRRTGGPIDGERQRVVEVRAAAPGERPGTVVEVVRPGYALGARIVREAEVVVAGEGGAASRSAPEAASGGKGA